MSFGQLLRDNSSSSSDEQTSSSRKRSRAVAEENEVATSSESQTAAEPSAAKRPRFAVGETADSNTVADMYNARGDGGLEARSQSSTFVLKKLNNWVKSCLLALYSADGSVVLDMCCGKGGDLLKLQKCHVSAVVGVDIATRSLDDLRKRYNELLKNGRADFPIVLRCADAFEISICEMIAPNTVFDLVSAQFSVHYAFETETRVRQMFRNAASQLRADGYFVGSIPDSDVLVKLWRRSATHSFGNGEFKVTFKRESADKSIKGSPFGHKYSFELKDAIERCPECLVHLPTFERIAAVFGLKLELSLNFHDFFAKYHSDRRFSAHLARDFSSFDSKKLPKEQWDIAYLYRVFAFRKVGTEVSATADCAPFDPPRNLLLTDIAVYKTV